MAASAPSPVPVDLIIEELWAHPRATPATPHKPASPGYARPSRSRSNSDPGGYEVGVDGWRLDATRFSELHRLGRELLTEGGGEGAAARPEGRWDYGEVRP